MKFKFLGTAAEEGIPALFCKCENCRKARRMGGKNIRMRSQALINSELLIDFNADTYTYSLRYGIDMADIHNCIITHAHADHLYAENINLRLPALSTIPDRKPFNIYGTAPVTEKLNQIFKRDNPMEDNVACFHTVSTYKPFKVLDYEITAFDARHDPKSGPVIYMIRQGGKTILYGNDTGCIFDETYQYFKDNNIRFDLVSLDCTEGFKEMDYDVHMNVERCLNVKNTLLKNGNADGDTLFYINHFSHNGKFVLYDEMVDKAKEQGFYVSYDGLEVKI